MTVFDIVKKLADSQKISIVELEEKLNFSRNSLYAWKKSNPSTEKLEAVADYFNVSTDYLLGRTDNPSIDKGEPEEEFTTFFRIDTKDIPEEDREKLEEELKEYFEFMKNRLKNK
ncbi:helix-turn-helix transcriptional regulator [Enterococcus ureasiticus]|uniref:helix-turn-helix domain-containing protein n=1 Tax=Enterococcus ureasiticus TaxID=903984 RepID=UPI001A8D93CC|nr:helix-turn-helix transcriptional regulator [Enterococcus ureasiticus]MBO0475075.1 helix-turn-helix transcriptional regulator [Enterococcus ureasiticus]